MAPADATHDAVLFQAMIVPQRSLSARGRLVLLGAVLLSSCLSATAFIALGAWPVGVFTALELALAAWLFRLHILAGRASELLLLSQEGLQVIRTSPRGARQAELLSADWMTVRLLERPGRVPALLLHSRGATREVARELGECAKRDLAAALQRALDHRARPVFDNPQLR